MFYQDLLHILESTTIILPEIILALGCLGLILTDLILHKQNNNAIAAWLCAGVLLLVMYAWHKQGVFQEIGFFYGKMLYFDEKAHIIQGFVLLSGLLVLVHQRLFRYSLQTEWYAIFLVILLALCLLAMVANMLLLYVIIELLSISTYILVAWDKQKPNAEAAIKYLIFGGTSSAIMLYGISMLYGMSGTLDFTADTFAKHLSASPDWVIQVSLLMALGGLFFKLAVVPFHAWIADVYEATPIALVAFLSTAPKLVALFVCFHLLSQVRVDSTNFIALIAMASVTVGNLSALWQDNFKRLLAYSSIAHAGFLLIGLLSLNGLGLQSAMFYATSYLFINWGAFVGAEILQKQSGSSQISSFSGLGIQNPLLGVCILVLMLALVGLPPTVGFTAKWLIFSALWDNYQHTNNIILFIVLIFGLLNAAISLAYYLKVVYYLFFKPSPHTERQPVSYLIPHISYLQYIWLLIFALLSVWWFFKPNALLQLF